MTGKGSRPAGFDTREYRGGLAHGTQTARLTEVDTRRVGRCRGPRAGPPLSCNGCALAPPPFVQRVVSSGCERKGPQRSRRGRWDRLSPPTSDFCVLIPRTKLECCCSFLQVHCDGGIQARALGHWLGTGNKVGGAKRFLPFEEALAVARSLNLASATEWNVWSKRLRPRNMPSEPHVVYKDHGWRGWGHWLGTGNTQCGTEQFLPFNEALAVARSIGQAGLSSSREWTAWCKNGMRPAGIPANPSTVYKDHGWQGWGHWLGTGTTSTHTMEFLPFAEALAVARSLNLASSMEWKVWSKEGLRPRNVPCRPDNVYKDHGWQGWGHWLGTGNQKGQKKNFLPFDQALRAARQLRLVSEKEWRLWCRTGARPANMPACPDQVYVHDGWMGWVHWLYHANLGPAPAPAAADAVQKRAAPGRTHTTPGKGSGKRQRR